MKILLAIYKYFPWGGLQKDTLRIAGEAVRRGHEVHIFTTDWQGPRPEGVALETVAVRGWSNHSRIRAFGRLFQERLQRGDIQVSLAMNRISGADFYFAADSCLKAYMPRKHPAWMLKLLPRYRAFLQMEADIFSAASSTRIFYIAEAQRRDFTREYGTPAERLIALPPGMNPLCRRPDNAGKIRLGIRRELGLSDEETLLIMVASGFLLKGADRVLQAMAALPEEVHSRCRMLIVGNVNRKEALRCASKLHLEDRLILTGPKDNVQDYLLAADLMVHPARQEGTGTVLIEAIASGLPVICSGACGFAPYVEASSGYVLEEPFRQEELNAILPRRMTALPENARRTLEYARTQDFCGRASAAVDYLEQAAASERR